MPWINDFDREPFNFRIDPQEEEVDSVEWLDQYQIIKKLNSSDFKVTPDTAAAFNCWLNHK